MPPQTDEQALNRAGKAALAVAAIVIPAYVWSTLLAFIVILLMGVVIILISALPQPSGDYGRTIMRIRISLYAACGVIVALILVTNKIVEKFPDWSDSIVDAVVANQQLAEKSETVEFDPDEHWQIAKPAIKENRIIRPLKDRIPKSVLLVPISLVGEYIADKAKNTASWVAVGVIVVLLLCCFAMYIGGKVQVNSLSLSSSENISAESKRSGSVNNA